MRMNVTTDTGERGAWFETDRSEKWDETTYWNGSNSISNATGSQWDHEALYRTASGVWVIKGWSQYQGRSDYCRKTTPIGAHAWLVRCGHDIPECLAEIDASCEL